MARVKNAVEVQPLLLAVPQVAASLGLGRTKVYELIATEGLPVVKFGTATRIPLASLQKWVERREKQSMSLLGK
ncbi:MAG TPA: helix-turn-helix domain-containing protein [Ktedonobacteraceae bacterium]|nr:helix-turn-helix domain-containing protein [Ktedonobacteraceae bacterium]